MELRTEGNDELILCSTAVLNIEIGICLVT